MHAIFIPYGKRSEVELMFRDMEAQKHRLLMWKRKKKKIIWMQGQLRMLPFGVCEYICPKEDMDTVLTTLNFKPNKDAYGLGKMIYTFLRKMVQCKKIPEYSDKLRYLWITENVTILPLGIREDKEFTDPIGKYKGWTHEAI